MIPACLAALRDPRLHRRDLVIYGLALHELDVAGFRSMKRLALAKQASMKPSNVSRSVRRLAVFGYLERGPLRENIRTYRLVYSLPVSQVIPRSVA